MARILMATDIYLIRHGQTDWNRDRICMGQSDIPLNAMGQAQARLAAERLCDHPISHIYSSDLRRTVETARPLAEALGLKTETDAAFRELDYGDWQGIPQDELPQRYPDAFRKDLRLDPLNFHPDGGERVKELYDRVTAAFERIVLDYPDQSLALVAHGGVVRCLANNVLGRGAHGLDQLFFSLGFTVSNGGITLVRAASDETPQLIYLNDTCHLASLSESSAAA